MDPISIVVGAVIFLLGILFGRVARKPKAQGDNCECGHSRAFHPGGKDGCMKYVGVFKVNTCDCMRFTGPPSTDELLAMTKEITNR